MNRILLSEFIFPSYNINGSIDECGGGIAEVPQQYEEVKSDKAQPAAKKQRSKSG